MPDRAAGARGAVDAGMCFQVIANGNPELAEHIADDIAGTALRLRDELLHHTKVVRHAQGVRLAKDAMKQGKVVLADHSDRTGAATWRARSPGWACGLATTTWS